MEVGFSFLFFSFLKKLFLLIEYYCQTWVERRIGEGEASPPNRDVTLMTSLYLHPQNPPFA